MFVFDIEDCPDLAAPPGWIKKPGFGNRYIHTNYFPAQTAASFFKSRQP